MNITQRSIFILRPLQNTIRSLHSSFSSHNEVQMCQISCQPTGQEEHGTQPHVPVMAKEALEILSPEPDQVIVDMTFGAGGHTHSILTSAPGVKVYALDRDPLAHSLAREMSNKFKDNLVPLLGCFSDLEHLLNNQGVAKNSVDGILFDCGCSSMQFDRSDRGFSLSKNGPLNMLMDGDRYKDQPTAADVVNTLDAHSLARIFKTYGEEKQSKRIAQAIVDARFMLKDIRTTQELADIVEAAVERKHRTDKLQRPAHVATKIFQALRIFVNNELNELNYGLHISHEFLRSGGKLLAITFHSLEDRIVKHHLMEIDISEPLSTTKGQRYRNAIVSYDKQEMDSFMAKKWLPINKKVITPSEEEVARNPRSRSAKLRAALKL